MSASHQRALSQLEHQSGVALVTGEGGTGKTSLLLALRERLDAETAVAHVFNTTLPFDGMVEFMLENLGIAKPEESPARRLIALNSFLSEREQAGQRTTLIIDEAQDLDVPTLAQIGTLANLEGATTDRRLQILLVASPEFETKLEHPDLRQLQETIVVRCRLQPLDAAEVREYIRDRLEAAGAGYPGLFSEGAADRIARYAGGIPRVINIVCDHCLLFAYADQKRCIDRRIADQAIAYVKEGRHEPFTSPSLDEASTPGRSRRIVEIVGIVLVSALAGFLLSLLSGG